MTKTTTRTLNMAMDHIEQAVVNYLNNFFKGGTVVGADVKFGTNSKGAEVNVIVEIDEVKTPDPVVEEKDENPPKKRTRSKKKEA